MPDVSNVSIEPAGFFGKLLGGQAIATTSPWTGNVTYNPDIMSKLRPEEVENTLTHELTHSRQILGTPAWQRPINVIKSLLPGFDEPYYQRPREMEAWQAERDRSMRLGLRDMTDPQTGGQDIELPPPSRRRKTLAMFVNDRTR